MSRNRGDSLCDCGCFLVIEEGQRRITKEEAGAYYDEYRDTYYFARAHCPVCLTLFLAWFSTLKGEIFDASYRHAFNDEPAVEDLPIYEIDDNGRRVRKLTLEEQPYGRVNDPYDNVRRKALLDGQEAWRRRCREAPAATAIEAFKEAVDDAQGHTG